MRLILAGSLLWAFPGCALREAYVRDKASDPRPVAVTAAPGGSLRFESKMTIDADGAGDAWREDPDGQPETALRYPDGTSLDPTKVPYIVLPVGFEGRYPTTRLGDLAAVTYRGRTVFAVYGDTGPEGQIGEGSIALARRLGIDPDPVRGGVDGGVAYVVFPGSGNGQPPSLDELESRGSALLGRR